MHNIESTGRSADRDINRRSLLSATGLVAAATLAGGTTFSAAAQQAAPTISGPSVEGRRKLGSLEVSSVGLGVQNMSRTYQTTIPTRPEMINIIRTAFSTLSRWWM